MGVPSSVVKLNQDVWIAARSTTNRLFGNRDVFTQFHDHIICSENRGRVGSLYVVLEDELHLQTAEMNLACKCYFRTSFVRAIRRCHCSVHLERHVERLLDLHLCVRERSVCGGLTLGR